MKITDSQPDLFDSNNTKGNAAHDLAIRVLCILYELTTKTTRPEFQDLDAALGTLKGFQLIKTVSVGGTATLLLTNEGIHTATNFIRDHKKTHNKILNIISQL